MESACRDFQVIQNSHPVPENWFPRMTLWLEMSAHGQRLSLQEKENRVGLTQQPVHLHHFTDDLILPKLPRSEQLFQSLEEVQRE